MIRAALWLAAACAITACSEEPPELEADVVIIGGGIAGISAALEASAHGATVHVIEWNSVPGGHAVKAGGFALVDTPLQRKKGHADSPALAYRDLMAWGEDADADWVRQFVERSRVDVYDWLTNMGVRFNLLIDTPEGSVPRFHFAGGTAVRVIVPMLREAFERTDIGWSMNSRVENIDLTANGIYIVHARDVRSDELRTYATRSVVLATGGFQGNIERVRRNWSTTARAPSRLLLGAGHFATGDGIRLGRSVGAGVQRLDDQVTFGDGLPDPHAPARGLKASNPAAIRVNSDGLRFVNESAPSKIVDAAVLALAEQTQWFIFDSAGLRKLRIRDAVWLNAATIKDVILANPDITATANTIEALAVATGLPPIQLSKTIERYNRFAAAGHDDDFLRFDRSGSAAVQAIEQAPFYALQLWPMTRKNLGGLAIDLETRVTDTHAQPIPGLYAAGEVTGAAGINGSYGGSGTFLAPSVLTGRMAGRGAAEHAIRTRNAVVKLNNPAEIAEPISESPKAIDLTTLIEDHREGYWHFEQSHRVVLERDYGCDRCHSMSWPTGAALARTARLEQLESCMQCH